MNVFEAPAARPKAPGARRQKVLSGLIFIGIAILALLQLRGIAFGSALQPGPGFFPVLLAAILTVLGLVNVVGGLLEASGTPLFEGWGKAVLLIPAAVAAFGFGIDRYGLVPSILVSTVLCGLASRRFRPIETLVLCVVLPAFGTAVFIYGLDLPFTAFPE